MQSLPVAIIGAGPVGLAAAAHLARYHQSFVVLEAGSQAGAAMREWAHVRTFSPWRYMIDSASRELLDGAGWRSPDPEQLPTGGELVAQYLSPLSGVAVLAPHIRYNARVTSVGRKDFDKVRTKGREAQPFEIRLASGEAIDARAVIDASGTWSRPNPAGSGGVATVGERELAGQIAYGIPDVLAQDRGRYSGKGIVVVGSGHSAFNVILDLLALAEQVPSTRITWVMRRENIESVWGGGSADALEARGELGQRARRAYEAGRLTVVSPYRIRSIAPHVAGVQITGTKIDDEQMLIADQLIVCTGFRPDLEMLSEVRLGMDPWLECPSALGPLIDPNEHSCGTVRPHGARELAHPEKDFYIAGMKSYGRAPTFLLATGYEQVRSIAAMLAGDTAAAERVELVLPETGVCSADAVAGASNCCGAAPINVSVPLSLTVAPAAVSCCGGPAPAETGACCNDDAVAKASGKLGCGCT